MSYWTRTAQEFEWADTRCSTIDMRWPVSQTVLLAQHGETEWTRSGQYTGLTDLSLTDRGEMEARSLGRALGRGRGRATFARVLTSPLRRSMATCEIAGFEENALVEPDLVEWDYGKYEGFTRDQIIRNRPEWELFRDGCPGGESPEQVALRVDRVIRDIRRVQGDVLVFSSGHVLRMFCARWLGLVPEAGRCFAMGSASLSSLGYEHNTSQPVIRFWDDRRHVAA